ncbi:MAG: endonuclease/exonuclease/phosphatase family protein [Spirochaetaceae bacterium]|nr:endonuclease/exonuclease/phosphatase family protein [Spirochaetaceae bacterium]
MESGQPRRLVTALISVALVLGVAAGAYSTGLAEVDVPSQVESSETISESDRVDGPMVPGDPDGPLAGGYTLVASDAEIVVASVRAIDEALQTGAAGLGSHVSVESAEALAGMRAQPLAIVEVLGAYTQVVAGTNLWLHACYAPTAQGNGAQSRPDSNLRELSAIVLWSLDGQPTLTDIDFDLSTGDWTPAGRPPAPPVPTTGTWGDATFLDRPSEDAFRLMSYNPYWDAIFPTGIRRYDKAAEFGRVLRAVGPDLVCIQEVDPRRDRAELLSIFDRALPLPAGQEWTVVSEADNVIVSRFPVLWTASEIVHGRGVRARGHVLALIDLPDESFDDDILIVGTHFVSGGERSDIQARTEHADALVAHVRNAVDRGMVPEGTPVLLAGDVNAYGTDPRRHLDTLILGDVTDEDTYGIDGSLDSAGVSMIDLLPVHNATGSSTWTWRDDTQDFDPYPLDRIIFTGSELVVVHAFVLNTAIMTEIDLEERGLAAGDVALNLADGDFDHLPLVADFSLTPGQP